MFLHFNFLNYCLLNINIPSPVAHLESIYLTCHNDSVKHWEVLGNSIQNIFVSINENKTFLNNNKNKIIDDIEIIKQKYKTCKNEYIDAHCWKFTPFIFRNIIDILYQTKFIDFQIERVYKTLKGSNEFYVIMKNNHLKT
jgi:hypothetical protein